MSVTSCSVCGGPLEGKYANALTCSSRCRQKAYRLRSKSRRNGSRPSRLAETRRAWSALTAQEQRQARDHFAREVTRLQDAQRRQAERDLFAEPECVA
jgi:hypothetical protein